ncbi:Glutathione synthetase [Conoideocrella luteorostrata]|uniref:Glutathione synthetase n=1 Tax=Conoideocrella luteorostrata TaxID=1105319 RepID=A0AAJ0FZF4_9HYPO|nr:Glutathione synthetase [Conoideocrella luteorostrata]
MRDDAGIEPSRTFPPLVTEGELEHLVQTVKDWATGHGLVVRPPPTVIAAEADPNNIAAVPAPVTLFPSGIARHAFRKGLAAQKAYNELYAAVSRSEEFLAQIVKEVIDGDDFVRDLWAVHQTKPLSLGLFRSDYMAHEDTSVFPPFQQLKQVEFNTIASSFGGLSVRTAQLHQFLSKTEYPLLRQSVPEGTLDLPQNKAIEGLAGGIEAAFHAYGAPQTGHRKCVIFLVQGDERNIWDQRHLEYQVAKTSPSIPVFRLAFADIMKYTSLAKTELRQLLYSSPRNPEKKFEAAVVYMRAGYGPGDYPNQQAWDARCHLERSHAIKCPTVLTQLAGTKKVQQVLATPRSSAGPSILSRFIKDDTPSAIELWNTFTNIYPMDTSEVGLVARKKALDPEQCQDFVLKPQREGGGNNIYGSAIPEYLKSINESHWGSYILMELIKPASVQNLILRNGRIEQGGVINELGVYGACLWNQNTGELLHNEEAGWLLRTKGDKSEEGGVAAGYGCMDSVSLTLTNVDIQEEAEARANQ